MPLRFVNVSISETIAPNNSRWQGNFYTTVVGVTDEGLIMESQRVNDGEWTKWKHVGEPESAQPEDISNIQF